MRLEVETLAEKDRQKPVADYVHDHDGDWVDRLQTNRIELNAMTTPQLIEWLDAKMAEHGDGKLIPPGDVLEQELAEQTERKVRADITERVLREARIDDQVAAAVAAIRTPDGAKLAREIARLFKRVPDAEWRSHNSGNLRRSRSVAKARGADHHIDRKAHSWPQARSSSATCTDARACTLRTRRSRQYIHNCRNLSRRHWNVPHGLLIRRRPFRKRRLGRPNLRRCRHCQMWVHAGMALLGVQPSGQPVSPKADIGTQKSPYPSYFPAQNSAAL